MELHFHPFKIEMVQELLLHDLNIAEGLLHQVIGNDGHTTAILSKITSDEAHSHLSGYVNKQNFGYWAEETPRLLHQSPFHSQKVTVWCGLSSFGILGHPFFKTTTDMQLW
jgi:hypothetical protein